MRNVTPALNSHFAEEVTTIATCWKLTRKDAMVLGFTDHDQSIEIDDIIYDSIAGFAATNVESSSNMAVDNLDIAGQIYESKITREDLLAGKYDFAKIEVFLVNYQQPNSGKLIQKTGIIGEVTLKKNSFYAEVRGLAQYLSQTLCETYSPNCRAQLGDNRCRVNLNQANYQVKGEISVVINNESFISHALHQEANWFKYGYLIWDSGNNQGSKMEIKEFADQKVTLSLPMAFNLQVGDRFTIIAGCDKSKESCINKFNNIINFRGEPDIPGTDKIMKTAGTK